VYITSPTGSWLIVLESSPVAHHWSSISTGCCCLHLIGVSCADLPMMPGPFSCSLLPPEARHTATIPELHDLLRNLVLQAKRAQSELQQKSVTHALQATSTDTSVSFGPPLIRFAQQSGVSTKDNPSIARRAATLDSMNHA
jgi:hypothetical protein